MGFPDTVVKRAVKVKSALTPRVKDGKLKRNKYIIKLESADSKVRG